MDTVGIAGASFSSDESRILFSSNRSGVWNAYTIPVAGGPWTQITDSVDSTYSVSYFPKDDRILFTRDEGGNELDHLYVRTPNGHDRDLTPGAKLKADFVGWSRDGSGFFVSSNERDGRFIDVYRYDSTTYERVLLFQNEGGYFPEGVSGDGRWVALVKRNSPSDSDLYLWNRDTKTVTHLSQHSGDAQYAPASFDPASQHLYYLTNDGGEFRRLRRYHIATARHEDVERADWDVIFARFSENGRYRVSGTSDDGRIVIRVFDTATGTPASLPASPEGDIRGVVIARSESKLAFFVNGDRAPSDLYIAHFGEGHAVKLTSSMNPEIEAVDLVDAQVVRFKARDGMSIPNILWKPHQATPVRKAPALVWVHGGPGGQTIRGYNPLIQYLVNHGYVVLGINNRGSSGYGKSFHTADDRRHGREPLWDCVDARKYLATLPYVDASRVGIIGASYGGYMVLAALAFEPDAFNVGVDIFGVANWVRTLESIPVWWEAQRKALHVELGDPARDLEMLRAISPVFHAEKIKKPLLVLQGANDPRVLKAESDDIVAAVKRNGVPVEYLVFDDEGHGFTKKRNQIAGYGAVLKFLDTHLSPKTTSTQ